MSLPPPPSHREEYDASGDNPYLYDPAPEDTIEEADRYPTAPTEADLTDPVFGLDDESDLFTDEYSDDLGYDNYEPTQTPGELRRFEGEGFVEVEQVHRQPRKFENDPTTWVDDFMFLAEGVYPFLLLVIGVSICAVASLKMDGSDLQSRMFDLGQTIALVGTGANVKQITSSKTKQK